MQPKITKIKTRENLQILLKKLPEPSCEAHRASVIMNNLLYASVIADAGCEVFLYGTGSDTSYNGEIITRVWRDIPTRLWRMSILPDGSKNSIPPNDNIIY